MYTTRLNLLRYLNNQRITHACEVGVFRGHYSRAILNNIHSLEVLYLVDLWEHQENYKDYANVSNEQFKNYLEETKKVTAPWEDKVKILKGHSTDMSKQIEDSSLDWCYIDARHDYKGCSEDILAYWPKVKDGGWLSGHDYLDADQVDKITPNQDWSICYDGTVDRRAVKGAVDEFAKSVSRNVFVGTEVWPTWTIQK